MYLCTWHGFLAQNNVPLYMAWLLIELNMYPVHGMASYSTRCVLWYMAWLLTGRGIQNTFLLEDLGVPYSGKIWRGLILANNSPKHIGEFLIWRDERMRIAR